MSKIFTRTFRVRWAELDVSGTVSPANYLRYIVETAWDWGTAIGWDENYSRNPDVFWVIRETEIRILRPLPQRRVQFNYLDGSLAESPWHALFELSLKVTGDVIAQGTQQVVYMDTKTGRPLSLPEVEIAKFRIDDPRVFPFERFPKVTAIGNPFVMQHPVESMDLDVYEHVNNATYVNYAEEAITQISSRGGSPTKLAEANLAIATRRVHIQYLSIASWGETLNISTHLSVVHDTGGSHYVRITQPRTALP